MSQAVFRNILIALLMSGGLFAGQAYSEEPASDPAQLSEKENAQGLELYRSKQFSDAKDHFEKAVEYNPKSYEALSNLAITEIKLGNFEASIKRSKEALGYASDDAESASSFYNLGKANEELGRLYTALSFYMRANELKASTARQETVTRIIKALPTYEEILPTIDLNVEKSPATDWNIRREKNRIPFSPFQFVQRGTKTVVTLIPYLKAHPYRTGQMNPTDMLFVYQTEKGIEIDKQPLTFNCTNAHEADVGDLEVWLEDWDFNNLRDVRMTSYESGRYSCDTYFLRNSEGRYTTEKGMLAELNNPQIQDGKMIRSSGCGSAYDCYSISYIYFQQKLLAKEYSSFFGSIATDERSVGESRFGFLIEDSLQQGSPAYKHYETVEDPDGKVKVEYYISSDIDSGRRNAKVITLEFNYKGFYELTDQEKIRLIDEKIANRADTP